MSDSLEVNEKYTIAGIESGNLHADRNGQYWRDLTGDKLVLALSQEIVELREANSDLRREADRVRSDAAWAIDGERMGR